MRIRTYDIFLQYSLYFELATFLRVLHSHLYMNNHYQKGFIKQSYTSLPEIFLTFVFLGDRPLQCCSYQVLSGQVRSACIATLQLGVWGHAEAMRLLLGSFLGQYNASPRPDNRVSQLPFLPIASYNTSFGFPWSFANLKSPTLRRWGLRDCNCSLARMESCWMKISEEFFTLFSAISQISTSHLCAWGLAWACAQQWY